MAKYDLKHNALDPLNLPLSNILRLRPYLQALISMIITLQVFADDFFSNMTFCQPLVYHPW